MKIIWGPNLYHPLLRVLISWILCNRARTNANSTSVFPRSAERAPSAGSLNERTLSVQMYVLLRKIVKKLFTICRTAGEKVSSRINKDVITDSHKAESHDFMWYFRLSHHITKMTYSSKIYSSKTSPQNEPSVEFIKHTLICWTN